MQRRAIVEPSVAFNPITRRDEPESGRVPRARSILTTTVTNTESALRTPTARRMLRGYRRGNQVLIFLSEADLPLEPLAVPLHTATCRVRGQEHTNESAPDSLSHGTLVEKPSPEVCSQPPYVLICTVGMAPACHVAALLGYTGIHSHAVTCKSMGVPKHLPKPGQHLRARRLSLGLTLRDVHKASLSLARELRKPAFVLPPSRLHEIETKKMTPSVHRLYTLARVYRCRLNELLSWYGIPPR
jgi:hypothetical protein